MEHNMSCPTKFLLNMIRGTAVVAPLVFQYEISYLQIVNEQLLIYCRFPGEISRISKHQYSVVTWSASSTHKKVYTTQE